MTRRRFGYNGAKIDTYITATDPLNIIQDMANFGSLGTTILPMAGGKRHYLAPKSVGAIFNGHSIDYSVQNLQGEKGFWEKTWDTIKAATTPPKFH